MRLVIACLLSLLSGPAWADVITLRSGEHERFSRLVLTIPVGRDWRLGRDGSGYAIDLGDSEDSFETSAVFERIPRDRIAELVDEGGRLRIDLACDCHADAFLWRPDRLVVDVIDGPAPGGSEFEIALDAPPAERPEPVQVPRPRVALPLITPTPRGEARPPLVPGTFTVTPPSDNRVADAERAILESLARAASQGVFDLPSRPLPIVPDSLTEDDAAPPARLPVLTPVSDPMDGVPSSLEGGPGGADGPGLVLRTGIDRANEPGGDVAESHCISDQMLSIEEWGDERDFSSQIADHRRILTSEFDTYPEGSIESLAKTYLFFGFGQEARQVLALDGKRTQERQVLDALSRVVDGMPQVNRVLAEQIDCSGFVVMWAALANDSLSGATEEGRNAAVMAFRILPDQLRGYLGARLAQLFLDAGDSTTADVILTGAARLDSGATVDAELTNAAVIETTQGPDQAIQMLDAMAEGNTRMTADGLVRLIDLLLEEERPVDDGILELASAMRFEARGNDDARLLGIAEIAARTARAEFDTAFEIAQDEDIPLTEEERTAQNSMIVTAIAERGEATEFLTLAFGDMPQQLSAEAENAVAARLLEVGFPERAMSILASPATQEAMAERRYLRAEAAADLGDLAALDEALTGLNDPRASRIRAEALAASGDFQSALAEELQSADAVPNPDEAWRAGAWTLLESGEDPLLQTASRAILTEPATLPSPPTLAARRNLLEEAQATRTMTEELLGRFNMDEERPATR